MDQTAGDGRWIRVLRGSPAEIKVALAEPVDLPPYASARVAAARRLVEGLDASEQVSLTLDLRGAQAGHVSWNRRRGVSAETFTVLPWMILHTSRIEVRLVRHMHRKVQRSFGSNRVNTDASTYALDELWVRGPQGVLRRPFLRLSSLLSSDLQGGEPHVPGWDRPLPPTAPGFGRGVGHASLAVGLVASVLLLVLLPMGFRRLAEPTLGKLPTELVVPQLSAPEARAAYAQEDRWSKRKALVGSGSLPDAERRRFLRSAVLDPGADLDVRLQAVEVLMTQEGDLGVTTAVVLDRRLGDMTARWTVTLRAKTLGRADAALLKSARSEAQVVRQQLLRGLVGHDDPRAVLVARGGLASGGPAVLRRAWAQALGSSRPGDPGVERQLQVSLQDPDAGVRRQAGWALIQVAPEGAAIHLLEAFRRTAREGHRRSRDVSENELALMSLARALVVVGEGESMREEMAAHVLSPRVQRAIDALQ